MLRIPLRVYMALFLSLIAAAIIIVCCKSSSTTTLLYFKPTTALVQESLSDVQAWRFDKQGHLVQTVQMQSWRHFKDQSVSEITLPVLTMHHADGSVWDISAKTGTSFQTQIRGKLEKLQLSDNVIVKLNQHNNRGWELKTEHLLFTAQKPTATTNDPVLVNSAGMEIRAVGIHADLENHKIKFLKDVKTHYVVPNA